MTIATFRPFPQYATRDDFARRINDVLGGKINITGVVTLTANVATTAVTDSRISGQSFISFQPVTANAAVEIGAGTMYTSAQSSGTMTITHANNAQTDRTFRYLVIG